MKLLSYSTSCKASLEGLNVNTRKSLVLYSAMGDCAPKKIGLHLGNLDYDNALAVAAADVQWQGRNGNRGKGRSGVTDGLFEKR
jgi:hypothetical protein